MGLTCFGFDTQPGAAHNRTVMRRVRGHRMRQANAGFTLIELLVVMSLIVVLATIGLAVYGNSVTRAKEAVLREDLYRMRQAIDQFYADKDRYPDSLEALVTEKYLRAIPVDPFTNSPDTWRTIPADLEPGDTLQPGIYDVRSGADALGLDGTNYADWE